MFEGELDKGSLLQEGALDYKQRGGAEGNMVWEGELDNNEYIRGEGSFLWEGELLVVKFSHPRANSHLLLSILLFSSPSHSSKLPSSPWKKDNYK